MSRNNKLLAILSLLTMLTFVFTSTAYSGVGNSTSHSSGSKSSKSSGSSSSSKSGTSSSSSSKSGTSSSSNPSSSSSSSQGSSSSSPGSTSGYAGNSSGAYTGSSSSPAAASKSAGWAAAALALVFGLPLLAVLAGIIILVIFLRKKKNRIESGAAADLYQSHDVDLTALKERDPDFNEEQFMARVSNIYVQLQEAWESKDWKKVRPFESDELFNMHKRQLQEFIDSNTTNVVDDIAVLKTALDNYREHGEIETLDVYLKARIRDYVKDDATKKVIEGDPKQEIIMEYILSMSRKKGVPTRIGEGTTVNTCPNCGANVSINASGECEYCGSVVTSGDFDWVLTRLDVLSQN